MKHSPKIFLILFCFCTSLLCITICSKCSPLYAFNDWVDANAFLTVGKSWMNGLIPYRDLFEQKGPILYLLYGIGSLISSSSFFGVYVLEVLSFSFVLYFAFQLFFKYVKKPYAFLGTFLFGVILTSSTFFVQGGSAEEFCLPFLMYSLYQYILCIEDESLQFKRFFFNGIVASIVALIKFNFLFFWFVWMGLLFLQKIVKNSFKKSFSCCGFFLLGFLIPIFLCSLYFLFCGAFQDFILCYITFNFQAYTIQESIFQRLLHGYQNFKNYFLFDKTIFHFTIFGFLGILFAKKNHENLWIKLFLVFSFLFLAFGIYFGGNPYIYYYLILEIYLLFGLVILFSFFEKRFQKRIVFFVILLFSLVFSYKTFLKSNNISDISLKKEDYVQYQFASVIQQKENPKILNYDFLDGGFYTATNVIPSTKYFMRQNIPYERFPKILDEQNRMIRETIVDFVIVREYFDNIGYHETIPDLNENYDLILVKKQEFERILFTYYLYQKKEEK